MKCSQFPISISKKYLGVKNGDIWECQLELTSNRSDTLMAWTNVCHCNVLTSTSISIRPGIFQETFFLSQTLTDESTNIFPKKMPHDQDEWKWVAFSVVSSWYNLQSVTTEVTRAKKLPSFQVLIDKFYKILRKFYRILKKFYRILRKFYRISRMEVWWKLKKFQMLENVEFIVSSMIRDHYYIELLLWIYWDQSFYNSVVIVLHNLLHSRETLQKVDLVTRLDVIKSAIMSAKRHGSFKVATTTTAAMRTTCRDWLLSAVYYSQLCCCNFVN